MRYLQIACLFLLLLSSVIASAQDYDYDQKQFTRTRGAFIYPRVGALDGFESSLVMSLLIGARVGQDCSIGVGFGYDDYSWGPVIPVFFALRVNATRKKSSPIVSGELGYGKSSNTRPGGERNGGLYLSLGTGVESFMTGDTALNLDVGHRFQWHGRHLGVPRSEREFSGTWLR